MRGRRLSPKGAEICGNNFQHAAQIKGRSLKRSHLYHGVQVALQQAGLTDACCAGSGWTSRGAMMIWSEFR
jgi:hypothetical protein